jgi:putative ABC transport system ATP-binding protein
MTQSAAEQPYIVCDNLVKVYKLAGLEVLALQGLELTVARGEMLAIVGPSGSGKSTLINILGGLDWPTAGKIMVGGVDLLGLSRRDLARYHRQKIGSVWQQSARNLVPFLTARQNVELPMLISGVRSRASTARAMELLEAVGLVDRARHLPGQLSGGQQQRVAIAVALANSPELVLADEPTGEMDSALAQTIWAAFRELNQRYALTVIIVTHDTRIAASADRVVRIRDGKISSETVRTMARPAG